MVGTARHLTRIPVEIAPTRSTKVEERRLKIRAILVMRPHEPCALEADLRGNCSFGPLAWIAIAVAFLLSRVPIEAQSDGPKIVPNSARVQFDAGGNLPNAPGENISLNAPLPPVHAATRFRSRNTPFDVEPSVTLHQQTFSRIGIGVGLSPLGVGANASIVLTQYFDARLAGNFLRFNLGRFEADGVNADAGMHLASGAAALDFYPFNTPIRLSAGLMFYNVNHVSATLRVAPGTGFTVNGESYYAGPDGSAPLTGVAALAFHAIRPAPTLTLGFGKFIPRSNRHWSFPSEFGVAFTGPPSANVTMAGTVCGNLALTDCGNAADASSPTGAAFNNALQTKLASWRRSLSRVPIFPIASGGLSYSFDTPWGRQTAR